MSSEVEKLVEELERTHEEGMPIGSKSAYKWDIQKECAYKLRAAIAKDGERERKLVEALRPFLGFAKYMEQHPRLGLADELYGLDMQVYLRQSDLQKLLAAYGPQAHPQEGAK